MDASKLNGWEKTEQKSPMKTPQFQELSFVQKTSLLSDTGLVVGEGIRLPILAPPLKKYCN